MDTFSIVQFVAGLALAIFGLRGLAKTPETIEKNRELASLEARALLNHRDAETSDERDYRLMRISAARWDVANGGRGEWLAAIVWRGMPMLVGVSLAARAIQSWL